MLNLAHKHVLAGLVWCALLGIAYVVMDGQTKPKVAVAGNSSSEVAIPRSRDGHFYVAGTVGGHAVTFMVDTGASTVSVSRGIAQRMGLPRGTSVTVVTANGNTIAEEIAGQTIAIGGITVNSARILVLDNLSPEALLGQNVLRHLEVIQTTDHMILRARRQ